MKSVCPQTAALKKMGELFKIVLGKFILQKNKKQKKPIDHII